MKTTFTSVSRFPGGRRFRNGRGAAAPALTADLYALLFLLIREPVEGRGIGAVDEQHAVQMVHLMLENPGEPLLRLDADLLPVAIQAAHQHLLRARHVSLEARDAQTALRSDDVAFPPDKLGVDDRVRPLAHVVD